MRVQRVLTILSLVVSLGAGCVSHASTAQSDSLTNPVVPQVFQTGGGEKWEYFSTGSTVGGPIVRGPLGRMWTGAFSIDRSGDYFLYPSPGIGGGGVTIGSDGNIWSFNTDYIFSMTPSGTIAYYQFSGCYISSIATGSDGNVWFAESACGALGRITPSGVITSFPIANAGCATALTAGPDGALWFACIGGNLVGRMDTSGNSTTYPLLTPNGRPQAITTGVDGNLWTWEEVGGDWVRVTPAGVVSEFPPRFKSKHYDGYIITQGPNGILYANSSLQNKVSKFNVRKLKAEDPIVLAPNQIASGIAVGPDHDLWFTTGSQTYPTQGGVQVLVTNPLTVTPTSVTMSIGDQRTVTAQRPSGNPSKIKAVSSNQSVATVSSNGDGSFIVYALGSGSATIKVNDGAGNFVLVSVTVN